MKRLASIMIVSAAASLSCSPVPNLLPVNDLNRPLDVAFMCFGAFPDPAGGSDLVVSGRPMRACHPANLFDPVPSTTSRTFAFMPESGSGGLTAVDADHWKLTDLDLFTGGFGQAPLGQLPSQISVSDDGCRLISANRGSCDLSLVDPSVLVAPVLYAQQSHDVTQPSPRTATLTIRPVRADGSFLVAAPGEAVFLPQDTSSLFDVTDPGAAQPLCGSDGAMVPPAGWPAQSAPVPWYALVTYPSCDLVAVIALPSGQIISSAHVRPTTDGKSVELIDAGTSPQCPASAACVGQNVGVIPPASASDAGPTAGDGSTGAAASDAGNSSDAGSPDAAAPDASGQAGGGAAGADAGNDAGATGGFFGGGALPGNQYVDVPYVPPAGVPIAPTGIAIRPDGSRAYVGLGNASYVLSIGLTSGGLSLPAVPVYLHEGVRGAPRVRLSVDPYSEVVAGRQGVFVGAEDPQAVMAPNYQQREYLYAVASDGTLRVVDVFLPGAETECETNLDPMNLPAGVSASTACAPVDPAHRRAFSVGPGIHFGSPAVDVAAADISTNPPDTSEQSVNGAHAWVLTNSGIVYLVNINPVLRKYTAAPTPPYAPQPVTEASPFVNTVRDRNDITYTVTLDPSSGPPRVDVLPSPPSTGPYIEPFWTQGSVLNATSLTPLYTQTGVFFPIEPTPDQPNDPIDRRAVTPQTWVVSWEGPLTSTRNTGVLFGAQDSQTRFLPNSGAQFPIDSLLLDGGTNYCQSGVVAGDLLTLSGCTQDAQCGPGERCLADTSVSSTAAGLPVNGLCVDPNRADQQSVDCAPFLQSVRRYKIVSAYPSQLVLRPHLDELVQSSLTPCTIQPADQPDECPDLVNDPTTAHFRCQTDPEGGPAPRCLNHCDDKTPCRAGRTCINLTSVAPLPPAALKECENDANCLCADAPPFSDLAKNQCFDQLVAYQVSAGDAFLVSGSSSGVMPTARTPASNDQLCASNPSPDPRFTFRIPLHAPACTNVDSTAISAIDSRLDPDALETNSQAQIDAARNAQALVDVATGFPAPSDPCLYIGGPAQGDPTSGSTIPTHVRALFRNAQLSFVMARVERAPTGQFVTSFDVHGGFNPQVVQEPTTVEVSMPARIVIGPVDALAQGTPWTDTSTEQRYLFVVDQRRLGREQAGPATRGQLLRIHPLGYTVTVGPATGTQPIFQDYNASGGLFPIQ